jgi:hypothetical protein
MQYLAKKYTKLKVKILTINSGFLIIEQSSPANCKMTHLFQKQKDIKPDVYQENRIK